MSLAPALVLREGDRQRLADLARLPSVPSGLAKRARIVLLAADGMANAQIARTVEVSRPTVIGWRDRYQRGGIKGLGDEARSGQAEISEADVVVATLADGGRPPQRLGITHWLARFLAAELGISFASVARIWRKWGIQPQRIETFKFSADPELEPRSVTWWACIWTRRTSGGAQRGREVPDPGAGPHRAELPLQPAATPVPTASCSVAASRAGGQA